ncbi:hypothetical protein ACISU4_01240 [Streptomyces wuyuanensis]|uniref:hypothetical protein n=1 Tax=Streptomyces wuyuanensis TaxID=1196353 RepID=UPI00380B1DB9
MSMYPPPAPFPGVRLWSLDFALGDGMTTYDMVASGPDPYEVLAGALPTDRRIAAVLAELTPVERAVAMAWADPQVSSWTEAASIIVALEEPLIAGLEPVALGERVRRKLKRLGARQAERAAAAGVAR